MWIPAGFLAEVAARLRSIMRQFQAMQSLLDRTNKLKKFLGRRISLTTPNRGPTTMAYKIRLFQIPSSAQNARTVSAVKGP